MALRQHLTDFKALLGRVANDDSISEAERADVLYHFHTMSKRLGGDVSRFAQQKTAEKHVSDIADAIERSGNLEREALEPIQRTRT